MLRSRRRRWRCRFRLEGLAGHASHRCAQDEAFAVLLNLDFLQPIEVGKQFAPFRL
jgi:hypothetical protein